MTQGSQSLDTVLATERLALTIQRVGKLKEAEELLETYVALLYEVQTYVFLV